MSLSNILTVCLAFAFIGTFLLAPLSIPANLSLVFLLAFSALPLIGYGAWSLIRPMLD